MDSRLSEQSQSEDDSENDSHLELKSVLSDSNSIHSSTDRLSSMGGHKISPKNLGGQGQGHSFGQGNNDRGANNKQTAKTTAAAVAPLPAPSQARTTTTSATGKTVVTQAANKNNTTNNKNTTSKTVTTTATTTTTKAATATTAATAAAIAAATNDNRAQSAMATQRMKDMLSEVQLNNNSGKAEKKTGQTAAATTNKTATTTNTTAAAATPTTAATSPTKGEDTKVVPMAPPPTNGPKPFHCLDRAWFPYMTDDGYEYFLTTSVEGIVHSQWEDPRTHGFVEEQDDEDD